MDSQTPPPSDPTPLHELSDALRPAVEQVRAAAPPAEAVERSINRAVHLGPPLRRRSRRWPAWSAAAAGIAAVVLVGYSLWPGQMLRVASPEKVAWNQPHPDTVPPTLTGEPWPATENETRPSMPQKPGSGRYTVEQLDDQRNEKLAKDKYLGEDNRDRMPKNSPVGSLGMPAINSPQPPRPGTGGVLSGDPAPTGRPDAAGERGPSGRTLPPVNLPPGQTTDYLGRSGTTNGSELGRGGGMMGVGGGLQGQGMMGGGMMGMGGMMGGFQGGGNFGMGGGGRGLRSDIPGPQADEKKGKDKDVASGRKVPAGERTKEREELKLMETEREVLAQKLEKLRELSQKQAVDVRFVQKAQKELQDAEKRLKTFQMKTADLKPEDKSPQVWHRDRSRPNFARVYVGDGNALELVSLHVSVTIDGPAPARSSITSSAIRTTGSSKAPSSIRCRPGPVPAISPCSSARPATPCPFASAAAATSRRCPPRRWRN